VGCVVAEQKSCVRWQAAEWPELCAELQCGHTTSPAVAMPGPVLLCPTSVAAAFPSADYLLDELESIAADARRLPPRAWRAPCAAQWATCSPSTPPPWRRRSTSSSGRRAAAPRRRRGGCKGVVLLMDGGGQRYIEWAASAVGGQASVAAGCTHACMQRWTEPPLLARSAVCLCASHPPPVCPGWLLPPRAQWS
jgi:hypothetical protein